MRKHLAQRTAGVILAAALGSGIAGHAAVAAEAGEDERAAQRERRGPAVTTSTALSTRPAVGSVAERPGGRYVEVPMVIVGFDRKVAAKAGYDVRRLPDGREYLALKGSAHATPPMTPADVKYGNCGKSWLWITDVGTRRYRVSTGFKIKYRAISYRWKVNVTGPSHAKTYKWGGGLRFRKSWSGSKVGKISQAGYYAGFVRAPSVAVLARGGVCTALGPSDSRYVN